MARKELTLIFDRKWIYAHRDEMGSPIDFIERQLIELLPPDIRTTRQSMDSIVVDWETDLYGSQRVKEMILSALLVGAGIVESANIVQILEDRLEEDRVKTERTVNSDRTVNAERAVKTQFGAHLSAAEEKRNEKRKELIRTVTEAMELSEKLNATVRGQRHAVSAFVEGLFGIRLLSEEKGRKGPRGIFLFAGPPGVGKTFLAETAASLLDLPYLRVDMSEYSDKEAVDDFNGVHPSFKNAHPGHVTEFVHENPDCILLFDEVEKAHHNVLHLFLQILEGGRLRDICMDREISFRDTIIIMTTNAGKNLYEDETRINLSGISPKTVINALKSDRNPVTHEPCFPAPIVSRMATGTIVMFNHLEPFSLREIVKGELEKNLKTIHKKSGLLFRAEENVSTALLYSQGGMADARTLKGTVGSFIRRELLDAFRHMLDSDKMSLEEIAFTVDEESAVPEVKNLFRAENPLNVFVFCGEKLKSVFEGLGIPEANFVFADRADQAKTVLKNQIDCVIIDVACGLRRHDEMPRDLEDADSEGIELFRTVREYYEEMPVYLCNTEETDSDANAFLSFIRNGARDVVDCRKPDRLPERIKAICTSVLMSKASYRFSRSNKVLSYNCVQLVSEDGKKAEVKLSALSLKRAVDAEDGEILSDVMRPDVRFSDVIGAGEAKRTLCGFLQALKDPASAKGRLPRGVLLYGPPGTGKTLLAKAFAGESDVAFIQKNATEFFNRYVGEGPRAVRNLFRTARRYAPSVIFIDEVDAFAKTRTGEQSGQSAEEILNTFFSEMDGFLRDEKRPVFVLAATNYAIDDSQGTARTLDPAFVRRFDRKICVELPDTDEREQFLEFYLKKNGVSDIDGSVIRNLAVRSYGKSPADLEMVVEYAFRRSRGERITAEDLNEALDAYCFGEEKSWDRSEVEKTAYHEAGHTLIQYLLQGAPAYVTIVSRGGYGGYMQRASDEKKFGYGKQELLDSVCCALGGRASEVHFFGKTAGTSTGVSSDLRVATETVRGMICTYGMAEDKLVSLTGKDAEAPFGSRLYEEINRVLCEQLERASELIAGHEEGVKALARALLEKNSLTGDEVSAVLAALDDGREGKND